MTLSLSAPPRNAAFYSFARSELAIAGRNVHHRKPTDTIERLRLRVRDGIGVHACASTGAPISAVHLDTADKLATDAPSIVRATHVVTCTAAQRVDLVRTAAAKRIRVVALEPAFFVSLRNRPGEHVAVVEHGLVGVGPTGREYEQGVSHAKSVALSGAGHKTHSIFLAQNRHVNARELACRSFTGNR